MAGIWLPSCLVAFLCVEVVLVLPVTCAGSGFGQEEGTYHLRTTILPPEDKVGLLLVTGPPTGVACRKVASWLVAQL